MNDRKKRNIIICSLCAVLVFMAVGFAVISQLLTITGSGKITGNWDIYIDSISPTEIGGQGVSVNSTVNIDKVSAVFEADLYKPGDYVEYTVVVKNDGTMDANLANVTLNSSKSHEYVEFTHDAVINTPLKAKEQMSFHVKVKFKDSVSTVESLEKTIVAIADLNLNFVQAVEIVDEHNVGDARKLIVSEDISKTTSDNVSYEFYNDGTLNILGTGEMKDFNITGEGATLYGILPDVSIPSNLIIKYFEQYGNIKYEDMACTENCVELGIPWTIQMKYMYPIYAILQGYTYEQFIEMIDGTAIMEKYVNDDVWILDAYRDFPGIVNFTIEDGITNIGSFALYLLSYEGEVVIPDSVKQIGKSAFSFSKITSLTLPTNELYTTVEEELCDNCVSLERVNISDNVTTIEKHAFDGCENLSKIKFSSSLKTIEWGAFYGTNLSNLVLPDGLTTIKKHAFGDMPKLQSITLPSSLTSIEGYPFSDSLLSTIYMKGRNDLSGITATEQTFGQYWYCKDYNNTNCFNIVYQP